MKDERVYIPLQYEDRPAQFVKRSFNPSKNEHKTRDGLYQLSVSLAVLSLLVHNGMYFTLSTILYPQLSVTKYQNACIASLLMIGAFFGSLALGPISDKIGRKWTCILAAVLTSVTWAMLLILPKNFDLSLLYIIRLISGFAMCLANASAVYVSEVTNKHWRPVFLGIGSFFMAVGVPISAVVGTILPWQSYALFNFVVSLLNILILIPVPESPHWLLRSQPERAKKVLMKLNKNKEDFNDEWKAMEARSSVKESSLFQDVNMMSREVRRPMLCLAIFFIFQQFGGVYVLTTYAFQILHTVTQSAQSIVSPISIAANASLSHTDPTKKRQFQLGDLHTLCFIGVGITRVVMSCFSAGLSRFIDSKHIFIWSTAGGAVSAFSFALAFSGIFGPVKNLILVAFLLLFQMFETCGMQSVAWSLIGQLIPLSYRAKGSGIMIAYTNILTFITFIGFPYAMGLVDLTCIFVFFGIVATVSCIFVYFYVPLTRGKTFAEIEEWFK